MSLQQIALDKQNEALRAQFATAEVEIDGVIQPMQMSVVVDGLTNFFRITVPAGVAGTITKRIFRNAGGEMVWEDAVNIIKSEPEIVIELAIQTSWKGA